MLSRLWFTIPFVFFFSLALAISDVANGRSSLPILNTTAPQATWFPAHVAEPLFSKRTLLAQRRKIEFFFRWMSASIWPEIRPFKDDVFYLRALEDPVFMSACDLPPVIDKSPEHAESLPRTVEDGTIREILQSLEAELIRRSTSERHQIARDLQEILRRNAGTEIDSAVSLADQQ
ncbi:hypothetical protein BDZ97DRAFT_1920575 [Flammula alnicola]|nr:hypothetical protein BDZ97DRAFT_1920575 [Flammula alnicola]